MDIETAKQRVRDLLALAHDQGAQKGEIDNAIRLARRLMERHGITEDDVPKDESQFIRESILTGSRRRCAWHEGLLHFIKRLTGSIDFYLEKRFDKKVCYVLFGPADDVKDAADLFRTWLGLVEDMGKRTHGGAYRGGGRDYCIGFVTGLHTQLDEILAKEEEAPTQKSEARGALVVVQSKEARKWLATEQNVTLKATPSSFSDIDDAEAYLGGVDDGKRANTNQRGKRLQT